MNKQQKNLAIFGATDLFSRYQEIKTTDPLKDHREKLLKNYHRRPWVRKSSSGKRHLDPNFGQFQSKIDAFVSVIISVTAERKMWFRIVPIGSDDEKVESDTISSSFHNRFIAPWQDRAVMDFGMALDIALFGRSIEFWPSIGQTYSENIPVSMVFPNQGAPIMPKKWAYFFVERRYTYAELMHILEDSDELTMNKWDQAYLKEIVDEPERYSSIVSERSEKHKHEQGNTGKNNSARFDDSFVFVFAFVKDMRDKEKPVSRYIFPAEFINPQGDAAKGESVRYLSDFKGYSKCISDNVAVRTTSISRSYWDIESFGNQIFLSTAFYDKSMSLVIRAANRNASIFLKSSNREVANRLQKFPDEEIQVVDPDVDVLQTGMKADTRALVEVVRTIMIDTEQSLAMAQSPGSQNVKGYAITAKEAEIRQSQENQAQTVSIKVFANIDTDFYRTLYYRATSGSDDDTKRHLDAFKRDMEKKNITDSVWSADNCYYIPNFSTAGSKSAAINTAQGVLQAIATPPASPGEAKAQRDLIAAFVGEGMVGQYINTIDDIDPSVSKAGGENEDLDNPNINPANVPVLPKDKHGVELGVHIGDYEFKLKAAQAIVQKAMQMPNLVHSFVLVSTANDIVKAQDNKGAHIAAHIQAGIRSKQAQDKFKPLIDKFEEMQKFQDQLSVQIDQVIAGLDKKMETSASQDLDYEHKKRMYELDATAKEQDIALKLTNTVDKNEEIAKARAAKIQDDVQKRATDLAFAEAQGQVKLNQKVNEQQDSPSS